MLSEHPPPFFACSLTNTLKKLGVSFTTTTVHADLDPPLLRRALQTLLYQKDPSTNEPAIVATWLEGLQDMFDDHPDSLRAFLSPMTIVRKNAKNDSKKSLNSEVNAPSLLPTSESLARVLLGIDKVQPDLLDLLVERLASLDGNEDEQSSNSPIPRLILHQLRWLDQVVDPLRMTSKLLEMLTVTSTAMRREIIVALPEIIDDGEYQNVIDVLKDLMNESAELTTPILDALANLNLAPELLTDVRQTVLARLSAADVEDLPVIVRFLLQSITTETVGDVISRIREQLDFKNLGRLSTAAKGSSQHRGRSQHHATYGTQNVQNAKKGSEAMILEAIRSGIRFHKFVKDAWVKAISEAERPSEHRILDILVLFLLHPITGMKKKVETILRRKLAAGSLSPDLIYDAIRYHADALREHFPAVLSLAEALLRGGDAAPAGNAGPVGEGAKRMYEAAFEVADSFYRQEVVGSLVTHIGSGAPSEVNVGLAALLAIVQRMPSEVQRFAIFVKGILDYLDNLQISQIRVLFEVYSVLAFENELWNADSVGSSSRAIDLYAARSKRAAAAITSSSFLNELTIVIRKQLQNPSERYKQMGVVAALAIARRLGSRDATGGFDGPVSDAELAERDPLLNEAVKIFRMVLENCEKSYPSLALAFDEMALLIASETLDPRLETWLNDRVARDFTETFVCEKDSATELPGLEDVAPEVWMNLDVDACDIVVNIYPSLAEHAQSAMFEGGRQRHGSSSGASPSASAVLVTLCAKFKLLQSCCKALNGGTLDDIDGLLGCGVVMYERVSINHMKVAYTPLMRDVACNALFYAINWFRELLNAFAGQNDEEAIGKNVMRLRDIGILERMLDELLQITPGFVPIGLRKEATLFAGGKSYFSSSVPASVAAVNWGSQVPSLRGNQDQASDDDDEEPGGGNSRGTKASLQKEAAVQFSSVEELRPHMRELEFDVCKIMRHEGVSRHILDTEMVEKEVDSVEIQVSELRYLLEDLCRKLERRLAPAAPSVPFFAKRGRPSDDSAADQGFALFDRCPQHLVVRNAVEIVPYLCRHLESVGEAVQAAGGDDVDAPEDSEAEDGGAGESVKDKRMNQLACFDLLIRSLYHLLSWPEFKNPEHRVILKMIFNAFSTRIQLESNSEQEPRALPPMKQLAGDAFDYLSCFTEKIPSATSAVSLLKLLSRVLELSPESKKRTSRIGELATLYLGKSGWTDWKAVKAENLAYLIRQQIKSSPQPIQVLESYVTTVIPALFQQDVEVLSAHPLLTRETLVVFYKACTLELVELVALSSSLDPNGGGPDAPPENHRGNDDNDDEDATARSVERLHVVVRCWHGLVSVVKMEDHRRQIMTLTLRYGRRFVDVFVKEALPVLDRAFRPRTEEVVAVLKSLQNSTRALQNVCSHSKVSKDLALTANVPQVRKSLEILLFRVKAMLDRNQCLNAFWIGNLKHRNIAGEEVSSQMPAERESSAEEDVEEEEEGTVEYEYDDEGNEEDHDPNKTGKQAPARPKPKPKHRTTKRARVFSRPEASDEEGEAAGEDDEGRGEEEEEGGGGERPMVAKKARRSGGEKTATTKGKGKGKSTTVTTKAKRKPRRRKETATTETTSSKTKRREEEMAETISSTMVASSDLERDDLEPPVHGQDEGEEDELEEVAESD